MECLLCKDLNLSEKTMIKVENNCFRINDYNESNITFNITEINTTVIGSCLYFNKSIFYGQYNCIEKPENTYYVINGNGNTGVIKQCDISCKSCYGESSENNTNCIECNKDYYKTQDSKTNCIREDLIPSNYYKNVTDNIYYKCYQNCKSCNGIYNLTIDNMHCLKCIDNYFSVEGKNNNCYSREELLNTEKYYYKDSDSAFYNCYFSCSRCQNIEPNEEQHYCINCSIGYYFLENTTNCYDMNFTKNGYYLDTLISEEENEIEPKFKKCYESCETCIKYKEIKDGKENHNCIECKDYYYKFKNDLGTYNCYDNKTQTIGNTIINTQNSAEGSEFEKDSYTFQEKKTEETIIKGNNTEKAFTSYINENITETYEKYETILKSTEKTDFNSEKINECDISCLTCYEKNKTKCIQCNIEQGYYPLYNDNSSCYKNETKMPGLYLDISVNPYIWKNFYEKSKTCPNGTYKYSQNNSCIETCPNNYIIYNNECIEKVNEQNIIISDFKNQILNDINSYKNSTKFINGTNFIAAVLSSDKLDPEEQIKNGISAIDLGNCTEVIKEHYNISRQENLIIFNIETKSEINNNNDTFNLGKNTQLDIYDISGRKLNLSVCKEGIKVMKYIGDATKELNIESAKSLSKQGIDVFNASNEFFNDICYEYESNDGKDIILNDRRTDIYQNATFCQAGCSYLGMNYNLMVANCKCDSSFLQEDDKNKINNNKSESDINNIKYFTKIFISNLVDFNYEVIRCYNLALNTKILLHNFGFFSLSGMLFLQIIFFLIYLIKKVNPIKIFMMNFNYKNKYKDNKNHTKHFPPKKHKNIDNSININKKTINNIIKNKNNKDKGEINLKKDESINEVNSPKKINSKNKNYIKNILNNNHQAYNELISQDNYELNKYDSNRNIYVSNNLEQTINIQVPILNINKKNFRKLKLSKRRNSHKIILKHENILNNVHKIETISGKENDKKNSNINKTKLIRILKNDEEIQDMDYEEAILHDNRTFLRIYWSFLLDSQIILETFCTDNYLDLFVIKLSFFIFNFQISFFLNALFYTDDYISDAYHNDGVLDFISGLPKVIYSFIATLITTNLLKMLSNSKTELIQVIRRRKKYHNYLHIINKKISKLKKKLIVYFIFTFSLGLFFLYYITTFCAVYRNSQKYWFYGCLESFAMDSFVSIIACIFLSLLRYISIRYRVKYCYALANFISIFF